MPLQKGEPKATTWIHDMDEVERILREEVEDYFGRGRVGKSDVNRQREKAFINITGKGSSQPIFRISVEVEEEHRQPGGPGPEPKGSNKLDLMIRVQRMGRGSRPIARKPTPGEPYPAKSQFRRRLQMVFEENNLRRGLMRAMRESRSEGNRMADQMFQKLVQTDADPKQAITEALNERMDQPPSQAIQQIERGIQAPYVKASESSLEDSVGISVSLQPEDEWPSGIYRNSDWIKFMLHPDGELDSNGKHYDLPTFRKRTVDTVQDAVQAINDYLKGVQ